MRGNKLIIFISLMLVTSVVIGLLIPNPGHDSNFVEFSLGGSRMTFQNAINVGKFCAVWTPSAWGGCSADCGGGTQTRTVSCTRGDGTPLNEIYCTDTKPALSQACNTGDCTPPPSDVCGQPQVAGKYNCRWSGGIPGNPSSSVYACEHSAGTCNHGLYCPGQSTTWCSGSGTYSITCSCSFNF